MSEKKIMPEDAAKVIERFKASPGMAELEAADHALILQRLEAGDPNIISEIAAILHEEAMVREHINMAVNHITGCIEGMADEAASKVVMAHRMATKMTDIHAQEEADKKINPTDQWLKN